MYRYQKISETFIPINSNTMPVSNSIDITELYDNDIVIIQNDEITLIDSKVKNVIHAGILHIKHRLSKNGKVYFKCVPNDSVLPMFYVPYKEKINFEKNPINKFVSFRYHSFDNTIPEGRLEQTFGNVNNLESFFDYRLFCKDLLISNKKFTQDTLKAIKNSESIEYENRRNKHVITIDSDDTTDYDDAISYENNCISIYIANVPSFMEQHQLWSHMVNKVSTIYLPGLKKSMLPNVLTDDILSLKESCDRNVFYMDIYYDDEIITDINFGNATINVRKNHIYESEELLSLPMYQNMLSICKKLHKNHRLIKEINNSYQLIEYLMIMMNNNSAIKLQEHGVGIFRSLTFTNDICNDSPKEIQDFIKTWNNSKSSYTVSKDIGHQMLQLDNYVHITSPIRRLVDVLNMMQLQMIYGTVYSHMAIDFYNSWIQRIDYINDSSKKIKKVQNECNIVYWCFNRTDKKIVCNAYVIDIDVEKCIYTVFLKEQNYIGKLHSTTPLNLYQYIQIKMFLFQHDSSVSRKIRLELYV